MKKLTFVAIALFAVACAKKDTADKVPEGAKVTAKDPKTEMPPAPSSKTVTITTKSPEAKAAFDHGVELVVNARGVVAAADFKKAIELDADFAQAHAMLGAVTPGADGMAELDKASALAAKLPEAEKTWIDGFRLIRTGDQVAAIAAFTKVTELAPDEWRAFMQLGIMANNNADYATGKTMFEKVAQLKPDVANVQNGLAYANAGLRQWDPAIAAAKKQTELLPKEPNPQDTLGEIQLMANKLDDSEKSFQQAVTMEPKFTIALQGVALSRAYRGDYKGAADAGMQRVSASADRNDKVDATIDLAWFAAASGKPADAVALLDGLDKDPDNAKAPAYAAAAIDHGMLLQLTGKYDDAAKMFAEGIKRAEKLPGMSQRGAARSNAIGLLRNAALSNKPAADADKLVAVTADGATTTSTKSVNAWAKGLAAWAKTGAKDAVVELAKCDRNAIACRFDLATAQAKAGDAAGAAATTKELSETFVRDASAVYFHSALAKPKK